MQWLSIGNDNTFEKYECLPLIDSLYLVGLLKMGENTNLKQDFWDEIIFDIIKCILDNYYYG